MIHAAAVLLATATLHSPGFHTPSQNIGCSSTRSSLRCDIVVQSNPRPRKPRSCDLAYGFAYTLTPRGRPRLICAGDTVAGTGPVLRYGRTWSRSAFRCTSRRSGLTCRNRGGHGFFLSRSRQRTF